MFRALLVIPLLANAWAVPLEERQAGPSVTISNGTVVGSSDGTVDSFKGIPFAQPPTGNNRLRAPQPLATKFGTFQATGIPMGCPQFYAQVNTTNLPSDAIGDVLDSPLGQAIQMTSEDCLNLNVQRPAGTTASSKLPVVVWVFGGGFEFGSTQTYDGTGLIQLSTTLRQPVVYVAINYRVGGFGFLAGPDLKAEHNTNLGLKDQRLALQWVQDNIAAFGGDPTKVTLWGESAGAISVFDQTIINGGDNTYKGRPLFRGGIMDSGSVVPALDVTSAPATNVYNTVLQNSGCASAADRLGCLRGLSETQFLSAVNSVPNIFGYRSLDLSYLPRPDPSDNFFSVSPEIAVASGNFAKVPIIIGDQQDEGTLFSLTLSNVTNTDALVSYLQTYFPSATRADVAGLVATYPTDPAAGSPFNTGLLNQLYPGFKRNAAILGDTTFTLTRRSYLSTVSSAVKSWSYLATYFYGTPFLGTFHASDILDAYLGVQPIPTQTIRTYVISFINNLDPNAITTAAPLISWPQWTTAKPQLINFGLLANTLTPDNFRQTSYNYLISRAAAGTFRV
ncbi:MAG: hypothetical protein Q9159_004240 [Coniocarpon cinnabarinum]